MPNQFEGLKNGNTYLELTPKSVARLEDGNTASAKIEKDEQFYHHGVLYTASAEIAQGADIVVSGAGQNCTASDKLTDQIKDAKDGIATLDSEKLDNSVIGKVEGANASQAWTVGERFMKDGLLKEVTNAIASSEAISSSNTTDKLVTDYLPKKGTFTGVSSATTGNVKISNSVLHVLSVKNTAGKIIIPYTVDSGTYMGTWVHVCNTNDLTPALSESINIEYYYL